MKKLFWVVLVALAVGFVACGTTDDEEDAGTDAGEDASADSDTDADTDTDADADTDADCTTEAEYVACDGTPASCEDIGADLDAQMFGCCDGEMLYYCDNTSTFNGGEDCSADTLSCCYDATNAYMSCI